MGGCSRSFASLPLDRPSQLLFVLVFVFLISLDVPVRDPTRLVSFPVSRHTSARSSHGDRRGGEPHHLFSNQHPTFDAVLGDPSSSPGVDAVILLSYSLRPTQHVFPIMFDHHDSFLSRNGVTEWPGSATGYASRPLHLSATHTRLSPGPPISLDGPYIGGSDGMYIRRPTFLLGGPLCTGGAPRMP